MIFNFLTVQVHRTDGPDEDFDDLTWPETVEFTNSLQDDVTVRRYVILDNGLPIDEWTRPS